MLWYLDFVPCKVWDNRIIISIEEYSLLTVPESHHGMGTHRLWFAELEEGVEVGGTFYNPCGTWVAYGPSQITGQKALRVIGNNHKNRLS